MEDETEKQVKNLERRMREAFANTAAELEKIRKQLQNVQEDITRMRSEVQTILQRK